MPLRTSPTRGDASRSPRRRPPTHAARAADGGLPARRPARRPYEVRQQIGSGGMGTVYLAVRVMTTTAVALKVLKSSLAGDELVQRFRTERHLLAGLSHPHVGRLLDGGTTPTACRYLSWSTSTAAARTATATPAISPPATAPPFAARLRCRPPRHQHTVIHATSSPATCSSPPTRPQGRGLRVAKRLARRRQPADAHRRRTRHALLHGPGAGRRKVHRRRPRHGRVTPWGRAVRAAHGPAALPRRHAAGHRLAGAARGAGAAVAAAPKPAARPGTVCLNACKKDPRKRYASAADLGADCAASWRRADRGAAVGAGAGLR